jgi:hypothetical protein
MLHGANRLAAKTVNVQAIALASSDQSLAPGGVCLVEPAFGFSTMLVLDIETPPEPAARRLVATDDGEAVGLLPRPRCDLLRLRQTVLVRLPKNQRPSPIGGDGRQAERLVL